MIALESEARHQDHYRARATDRPDNLTCHVAPRIIDPIERDQGVSGVAGFDVEDVLPALEGCIGFLIRLSQRFPLKPCEPIP